MRRVVKLEVQPNVREGAVARRIASAALQDDHANAEEIADVELVTSELVTNAVEASTGSGAVAFSMELSDDDIRVSVANPLLGVLLNVVRSTDQCAPWTFGVSHLMRNLAGRGLL